MFPFFHHVMKRISGFDTGKGIAVLGMIIAHSFEGGICQWDYEVERNFFKKINIAFILLFSPLALVLLMGLFFTYISSITCTLSVIHKDNNKKEVVLLYIVYRLVFALVLKWMEIILTAWWKNYDIFETMHLQFPVAIIPRYSHTLDSVGVCGWFIPLIVYGIRRIRFLSKPCHQIILLTSIAVLFLCFSQPIASFSLQIGLFFEHHGMNLLSLFFSKIGSGPFMLAQTIPFGLLGGVIAIILSEYSTYRILRRFDLIFSICTIVIAGLSLCFTHDFWNAVARESKPPSVRLMELVIETNCIVAGLSLMEDPERSHAKRLTIIRKCTFLRRISMLSLTFFIFEQFVCKEIMKMFQLFFGMAVNLDTKEYIWSIPITILFAGVVTTVDLLIIRLWEGGSFRFSCEYFIGVIMSWLFNQKTYNRVDYQIIVYLPNEVPIERKRSCSIWFVCYDKELLLSC